PQTLRQKDRRTRKVLPDSGERQGARVPPAHRRGSISQVPGQRGRASEGSAGPFVICGTSREMLKTTPLNAIHKSSGARTVDFGGWDMPVNYGSQIEEHHAVRREWGLFDVSHMLAVDLEGPGVREFLRRALANDVAKLKAPGKALYSCMLNEEGGVVDDLITYFFCEDWFRLVVNAGTAEK